MLVFMRLLFQENVEEECVFCVRVVALVCTSKESSFVLVKQSKIFCTSKATLTRLLFKEHVEVEQLLRLHHLILLHRNELLLQTAHRSRGFYVSICTFLLVKQANLHSWYIRSTALLHALAA